MDGHSHEPHTFHSVGAEHRSSVWDNQAEPILEVESGEKIEFETADSSGGQLDRNSTAADVTTMDMSKVNPVTGPVFVEDEPGDTLEVEILELKPNEWGWTAIIPQFGLLADEFPEPWLNISEVDGTGRRVRFNDRVTLPFEPFPGTIGLAPAEPGQFSVLPPTKWGGNIDVKHLTPGARLYLPVGVDGGLFSVGDTHAAMGDGEVCGTAVESGMNIAVRLTVHKHRTIPAPQFALPSMHLSKREQSGYHICTGVNPDLMEATRDAIRATIDHIQEAHDLDRETAYAITSVAADVRIHELVDAPNWVVGAFLPDDIFAN